MVLFSIGIWRIQFCGTWKIGFFLYKSLTKKTYYPYIFKSCSPQKVLSRMREKPAFNLKNGFKPLSFTTVKSGHLHL